MTRFRTSVASILAMIGLAAVLTPAAPARAQVVTLQCTFVPQMGAPIGGTQYTVDIDLTAGLVRYANGVTYRIDEVTDRYVYFGSDTRAYGNASPWRLDRRTGVTEARSRAGAFSTQSACRRVQGTVF